MSNNTVTPSEFFSPDTQVANLALIACPGAEVLTQQIDGHLKAWAKEVGIEKETFIIDCACPRFQSGDAKGLVKQSVRGDDIFFVVDPGNYSLTYNLFGHENHMSPDDHFANLKRLIQAVAGRSHRMTVIMPPCTVAVSIAVSSGSPWTAPWLCRSCSRWACRTSSPSTLMTPA